MLAKELDEGIVGDHVRQFSAQDLIPESIHIPDLFARLRQQDRVFVTTSNVVCGIITRADLNKPPVRLYLFGLISLLEMHMQFWVATEYSDDAWQQTLSPERMTKAQAVYQERIATDEGITLLDCIQFCDKKNLFAKRPALLLNLGLPPKNKTQGLLKHAEDLRNNLAHSQLDLAKGTTWEELLELIKTIQALVHRSDEVVEEQARFQFANTSPDGLWVSQIDHLAEQGDPVEAVETAAK